jgi:antitoxin YobK
MLDSLSEKHKDKEIHERISALIAESRDENSFTGGYPMLAIIECEETLSVKFPDDYIWFLRNYGSGQVCGRAILGIDPTLSNSVVKTTRHCRSLGMPENFIVIINNEEYFFCINTKDGKIMNWSSYETAIYVTSENFIDFLLEEVENAINLKAELSIM